MSERDLYLMFLPQIAELIVDCQRMTQKSYEQWINETRESVPVDAIDFMEKVFIVIDKYSGHQKVNNDLHIETFVCSDAK